MPKIETTVEKQARLDVLCAEAADASRSQAAKWIESGLCTVNGTVQNKTSFKAPAGAVLAVFGLAAAERRATRWDTRWNF